MNAFKLEKIVRRPKKRIGRGHGSGKVKTAGRGTKGQNARDSMPPGFEGGQLALIRRLPLLRGKGKNAGRLVKAVPVDVGKLDSLPANSEVTLAALKKYHIIDDDVVRVKLLGGSSVKQKLTVSLPASKSARKAIEKAGGTVNV